METFNIVRRIVIFILGSWIIIDAIYDKTNVIAKLVVGMIMVGMLPVEDLLFVSGRRKRNEETKSTHEEDRPDP